MIVTETAHHGYVAAKGVSGIKSNTYVLDLNGRGDRISKKLGRKFIDEGLSGLSDCSFKSHGMSICYLLITRLSSFPFNLCMHDYVFIEDGCCIKSVYTITNFIPQYIWLLLLSRHSLLPILSFARSIMSDNRMRFFKSDCKDISIFI